MTTCYTLTETLINCDQAPPPIMPSIPTLTHYSVSKLADGHTNNPVANDPLEKGYSKWVWGEVTEQCWLAGPIVVVNITQALMAVTTMAFVGHFGGLYLAAVSMASSFWTLICITLLMGLGSALETLCGQAYGAKKYHMLGIYLQRGTFILLVAAIPISVALFYMGTFLVALGQDPLIASKAQSYARLLVPTLFSVACATTLVKFCQSQRVVFHLVILSLGNLVLHLPLCWLLIIELNLGYLGAAVATSFTSIFNLVLNAAFVRFSSHFEKTLIPLSKEAFRDLGGFFKHAIPSAVMLCLENWSIEVLTLIAGVLPNPQLEVSVLSICLIVSALTNMVPVALGVAASVRVSNELGAGRPRSARSALAVAVGIGLVQGVFMGGLVFSLRNLWGRIFSNEEEIVLYVAKLAAYPAMLAILYGIQGVLSGALRGSGRQKLGACANLGAYYGVGLPVAVVLVFVHHFDGRGLWIGLLCGMLTQTVALICIILCINWDTLARPRKLWNVSMQQAHPYL